MRSWLFLALNRDVLVCCSSNVEEQQTRTKDSGSNRDRSLHIRMNIAVVGECSRRGESKLERLIRRDIAG